MANYNKNVFVGTGGVEGINESHFIGAAYGMERMMGRADTPLRRILNYAQDHFCKHLPLLYVLTVVGTNERRELVTRGLFIGDDHDCYEQAAALSIQVNFTILQGRAAEGRRLSRRRRVPQHVARQQVDLSHADGDRRSGRTRRARAGREDVRRRSADRRADSQVRLPHDARDHAASCRTTPTCKATSRRRPI